MCSQRVCVVDLPFHRCPVRYNSLSFLIRKEGRRSRGFGRPELRVGLLWSSRASCESSKQSRDSGYKKERKEHSHDTAGCMSYVKMTT